MQLSKFLDEPKQKRRNVYCTTSLYPPYALRNPYFDRLWQDLTTKTAPWARRAFKHLGKSGLGSRPFKVPRSESFLLSPRPSAHLLRHRFIQ